MGEFRMSTFQNPNTKQNLNPYPTSSNQYPNPKVAAPASASKLLTFDDVSKFFSSPLSDAADSLGVCTSVLKRICHENGLERWPYRKIRAGKSIEEIRREAAQEKDKHFKDSSGAARPLNNASTTSSVPSPYFRASQVEDKLASSVQPMQKPSNVPHQQGNKNPPTGNTQKVQVSNLPRGISAGLDEFKYGFPADGLATVSNKWWGSSNSSADGGKEIPGNNQTPTKQLDSDTGSSVMEVENGSNTTENCKLDHLGEDSLSALRKRAVKESQEALKLSVQQRCNLNKLNPKQKSALLQIFKSSLPSQWIDESSS